MFQNTSDFQNSSLCGTCLENLEAACEFKTSLENVQRISSKEIKEEFSSEKTFVTCCFCQNSVKQTSAVPLQDYLYLGDVVNNLILKKVSNFTLITLPSERPVYQNEIHAE